MNMKDNRNVLQVFISNLHDHDMTVLVEFLTNYMLNFSLYNHYCLGQGNTMAICVQ